MTHILGLLSALTFAAANGATHPLRTSLCDVLLARPGSLDAHPVVDVSNAGPFIDRLDPPATLRGQLAALSERNAPWMAPKTYHGPGSVAPRTGIEGLLRAVRGTNYRAHEVRGEVAIRAALVDLRRALARADAGHVTSDVNGYSVIGAAVGAANATGLTMMTLGHLDTVSDAAATIGIDAFVAAVWGVLYYNYGHERFAIEVAEVERWLDRVRTDADQVVYTAFARTRADRSEPPPNFVTFVGRGVARVLGVGRAHAFFWTYAYVDPADGRPVWLLGTPDL